MSGIRFGKEFGNIYKFSIEFGCRIIANFEFPFELLYLIIFNKDKNCLNKCCGGIYSIDTCSKAGKIGGSISGKKHKDNGTGLFSLTPEQKSEFGKMGGLANVNSGHIRELGKKTSKENIEKRKGIFAYNKTQKSEICKLGGTKTYQLKKGFFSLTPEERAKASKKANETNKKNKTGIYSITPEERAKTSKKANETNKKNKTGIYSITSKQLSEIAKKTNSQKWQCTITGFIANPGNLSQYQKARGIDKSMRIRLE